MKRFGVRLIALVVGVLGLSATVLGVPAMAAGEHDNAGATPPQQVVAGFEVAASSASGSGSTQSLIRLDVRWNDLRVWEW